MSKNVKSYKKINYFPLSEWGEGMFSSFLFQTDNICCIYVQVQVSFFPNSLNCECRSEPLQIFQVSRCNKISVYWFHYSLSIANPSKLSKVHLKMNNAYSHFHDTFWVVETNNAHQITIITHRIQIWYTAI